MGYCLKLYVEDRDGWWRISKKFAARFSIIIGISIATVIDVFLFFLILAISTLSLINMYNLMIIIFSFIIIAILSIAGIYFWFTGRVERLEEIEFLGDREKFEKTIVDFKKMIGKMFDGPTIKIIYTSENLKMYNLPFIHCKINIKFISLELPLYSI